MTRNEYGSAYEQGFRPTVRFLVSRGVPPDTAEELAQAAWTRGWERISQLRAREVLRTWVNTIALNMYRRVLQRDSLKAPLLDRAVKPDSRAAAIELHRVLESCCPNDRLLLTYQLHGLTTSEMARRVGTSETAVRIRLMRARRSARSVSGETYSGVKRHKSRIAVERLAGERRNDEDTFEQQVSELTSR